MKSEILFQKGWLHEAAKHYQLALKASPKEAGIHYNLAKTLKLMGEKNKAQQHLQKALKLNPDLKKLGNLITKNLGFQ